MSQPRSLGAALGLVRREGAQPLGGCLLLPQHLRLLVPLIDDEHLAPVRRAPTETGVLGRGAAPHQGGQQPETEEDARQVSRVPERVRGVAILGQAT